MCQPDVLSPCNNQTWELERQGLPLIGVEWHCGNKLWLWWAHQMHPVSPGHIFGMSGWAQSVQFQRSDLPALCYGSLQLLLKLLIWWIDKADEYLFPGWKFPWWQLNESLTHCELDAASTSSVTSSLSAWYWGELWPDSPTYARFPNLLYTAELLCIKQNKNKVLPPYVNSPCHKVEDTGNSTSSFSISAILHSWMLGYSCFLSANILIISWHPSIIFVGVYWFVSIGMHLGIF